MDSSLTSSCTLRARHHRPSCTCNRYDVQRSFLWTVHCPAWLVGLRHRGWNPLSSLLVHERNVCSNIRARPQRLLQYSARVACRSSGQAGHIARLHGCRCNILGTVSLRSFPHYTSFCDWLLACQFCHVALWIVTTVFVKCL